MDHGHGLVDRTLFAVPLAFRPTLTEMETAADHLSTEVVDNFDEISTRMTGKFFSPSTKTHNNSLETILTSLLLR